MKTGRIVAVLFSISGLMGMFGQDVKPNPYTVLMQKAVAHAQAHRGTAKQYLSPNTILVQKGDVDVEAIHAAGAGVVVWTPNDEPLIREMIAKKVDGVITDDPELLLGILKDERAKAPGDAAKLKYLDAFESSAHRGGRADRPENTLPSFENGLDSGIGVLETDAGVTSDGVAAIWHESYYHPESCRKTDGSAYTDENKVWIRSVTFVQAQKMFVCDIDRYARKGKEDFSGKQKNDLTLSPVSAAFARKEGLPSPYTPINMAQLFRFVKFYTWYYGSGPGKSSPMASERAAEGARVRVAPEIKYDFDVKVPHARATAQEFVTAFGSAIREEGMMDRVEIQSFYLPSLVLVQEQFPKIPTYYLTMNLLNLKEPYTVPAIQVF